ncbi:MAG TPA: hypothetical protein DHV36_17845 [Desulfobacteraceae bacterium]|mgnify:CR=1 FL=1|nr:hypothetical protein [Desulfobacteraceae bacterium]|tara:strand:+ start:90 stop:467 length:378 start_codon:yes stop_codon:yes gene_type:complete
MNKAVFVSRDKDQFLELEKMLNLKNICVEWTGTGKETLSLLSNTAEPVDLVVLAEDLPDTGPRDLVSAVTTHRAFTHCVVAGTMNHKDFHDHYEGYGVLMQIPPHPTPEDAAALERHLDKLDELS